MFFKLFLSTLLCLFYIIITNHCLQPKPPLIASVTEIKLKWGKEKNAALPTNRNDSEY